MTAYRVRAGALEREQFLSAALELGKERWPVISLVGAGGKTSVMYQLAKERTAAGVPVIVTTSTHIQKPENLPENGRLLYAKRAQEVLEAVGLDLETEQSDHLPDPGILLVTGQPAESGKLRGLPLVELENLAAVCRQDARDAVCPTLLIEADGSRRMPMKAPETHEPVIISGTETVIACLGLSAVGRPLGEVCFRAERAADVLGIALNERVTPEIAAELLLSREGGRKLAEGREFRIVLNQADTPERIEAGLETAKVIADRASCVLTCFETEQGPFCERR